MLKPTRAILVVVSLCLVVTKVSAQAPPCPGFHPGNNVNLACEIATAARTSSSGSQTLGDLSPTVAAQLSQLPLTTAVSGSTVVFSGSGLPTTTESLGTILTQRGETLGRKKWFLSFSYQRFGFGSIDGISLKHLDTVNVAPSGSSQVFVAAQNRVDLLVNQFTAIGSVGLTNRLDVSVLVPFSKVTLKTGSSGEQIDTASNNPPFAIVPIFLAGSATGIGDVAVDMKFRATNWEKTAIAAGGEVRFPTGDERNYLGTGAYGVKPYVVISHNSGIITPNVNLGYQWNGPSSLFINSAGTHLNLPSSFLYSGGADFRVVNNRLTLTAEFLGQAVINGPRIAVASSPVPSFGNIRPFSGTYAMDNLGGGFKYRPFAGLLITGNALFALDNGGLRSKIVPLVGVSYRFK
ncbi:MAG TPA: hypothetical protein VKY85_23515 [Candidatus Angelobacter sp.]|nr:hypothetical protein [Candidatus Angelobacter sp.]